MAKTIRIKEGLLQRLREVRHIPTEEIQARMIGVDRTTLRRIDRGSAPSPAFMAGVNEAFGLGLSEAFDVVDVPSIHAAPEVTAAEKVSA